MSVMSSSLALSRPLLLEDGRCLRTLADAGELVLSLTPEEQAQPRWQAVVSELIGEIRSGEPDHVPVVTDQIARALSEPPFGSVRLADSAPASLPAAIPLPAAAPDIAPRAAPDIAPRAESQPRYAVIAGCEFLSILAVVLTTGVMLLGRP
jgi:hypothetical protein